MKTRHYILFSLLALTASCGKKQAETTVAPIKVAVEVAGVSTSVDNRDYVGEIVAESSTAVSSLAPGTVTRVMVEEGQNVSSGQTLATMDPSQAQNALNSARATLAQAQDAYQRMSVLHEKKSISDIDWVSVQTKLQQAQSAVESCRKAVLDCNITAPCAGVIGKKNVESGMTVLPTQPICSIINISSVKVKITVPEKELPSFTPSTRTRITVKALNTTFAGGRVETSVEGNTISRTYDVFIHVPNNGRQLRPGMVCDVTVKGKGAKGMSSSVITLPVTAVHHRASGDMFVWKDVDGVAKRVVVKVGVTVGDRIEIVEGVSRGDKIITDGYQKLSDGSSINVKG